MDDDEATTVSGAAGNLDVDGAYESATGSHGLWQIIIVLIVCFSTSMPITFPVFANAVPKFRCKLDPLNEMALVSQNLTFDQIASIVGPQETSAAEGSGYGCKRYVDVNVKNQTETCLNGYVYEPLDHQYPTSVVQSFDLVCEDAWKSPFSTSMYMLGMMAGFMLGGFLGDRLGRKKGIFVSGVFEIIFGIAVSFAPNFATYTALRSLLSAACTAKVASITVLLVEITTAKHRATFSAVFSIYVNFLSRGTHAVLAMWIPNWRHLHLAVMIPACLGLFIMPLLWESPRWLMSLGRPKDAFNILYKAHRLNTSCCGKDRRLSEATFMNKVGYVEPPANANDNGSSKDKPKSQCLAAFTAPYQNWDIAKRSIICTGLFTGQLCCFFGLLFYTRVIRGSVYYVAMINAVASVPAALISTVLYNRVRSRKRPLAVIYAVSAIILLIGGGYVMGVPKESDLALIVCCNIALVLQGASFNMIFIYTSELFPSSIRTQGLGNASGLGRIGSILCSFINQLDLQYRHGLPVVIYGCVLVAQTLLTCCLSDTTGENLRDVVEVQEKEEEEGSSDGEKGDGDSVA